MNKSLLHHKKSEIRVSLNPRFLKLPLLSPTLPFFPVNKSQKLVLINKVLYIVLSTVF